MNNYLQLIIFIKPYEEFLSDLLSESLAEIGFESFENKPDCLLAYIKSDTFDKDKFQTILIEFPFDADFSYEIMEIETVNWNEEWEKNYFEPILIGDECVIHSTFHKNVPTTKYEIIIDPKMSFGTGHHETTSQMLEYILKTNLNGKRVLDMGCGTAVLAILASMRGAVELEAIDIDPWCTENSEENLKLNHIENVKVFQGGAEILEGKAFDVILANINRNILLQDMKYYATCLQAGGELYMSGFYIEDIPMLEMEADKLGLKLIDSTSKNNWASVKMLKI